MVLYYDHLHETEHTTIRCYPCEFSDEKKEARNVMKDHMVSELVISDDSSRISPNLRTSDYIRSESSEDIS